MDSKFTIADSKLSFFIVHATISSLLIREDLISSINLINIFSKSSLSLKVSKYPAS